ncbi:MAG TPA: hypothetical protein VHM19_17055 [Polyangiales bacterium]|jgi:hypothetical protein|nr:hypothetical protein [Polyangiales bacterium]
MNRAWLLLLLVASGCSGAQVAVFDNGRAMEPTPAVSSHETKAPPPRPQDAGSSANDDTAAMERAVDAIRAKRQADASTVTK